MARIISRMFDSHHQALRALDALDDAGVPREDISLIANNAEPWHEPRSFAPDRKDREAGAQHDHPDNIHASHGLAKGAAAGGAIGGGAALLAGFGMLAIPGMGPVLAGGFLASALAGAATGAIAGGWLGAMKDAGVTEHEAHTYAEGVRRGGSVVIVRSDEEDAARLEALLAGCGGVDADSRRRDYEASGWSGYDESRGPASPDEIAAERGRYDPGI